MIVSIHYISQKYIMKYSKFDSELCDNKMTFQECELAILRDAVDAAELEHTKGWHC